MIRLTRKQKQIVRAYWSYIPLKFMKDGSVMAKKGACWGILLSPQQLEETAKFIGFVK